MEHKIGEIVTLPDGRKVEVVESEDRTDCTGCALFDYTDIDCPICGMLIRADHTNVIYKEIKED